MRQMTTFMQDLDTFFPFVEKHPPSCYTRKRIEKGTHKKGMLFMKNWFKAFAVMASCTIMLGTAGVASADEYEYEGYDENGNYVYAVTDEQGNVAVAVADADGNYAVVAEGADGSSYEETGSY